LADKENNRRVYAIGDIHGRSDLLDRIIEEIKKHDKIFEKFKISMKDSEFFIIFLNA